MFNRRFIMKGLTAMFASSSFIDVNASTSGKASRVVHDTNRVPGKTSLYSTSVSWHDLLFVSGKSSKDAPPGDIKAHTRWVLALIEKELAAAGSSLEKVLKVNVYLRDMADYEGMNEVFQGHFGDAPPARTTVGTGIPRDSSIELDVIAGI
jgi:2-iminobutanoate/2-iminopropanoate deaminase